MKNKIFLTILGLLTFAMLISFAQAQVLATIDVKESGTSIKGQTVLINTEVTVHGYYQEQTGLTATATMKVYYNDGTGKTLDATLYEGQITNGTEITRTYNMTKIGTYEFTWDCKIQSTTNTASFSTFCNNPRGFDFTNIFVVPEPATVAGLLMAMSAFGIFALKRLKK